MGNNEAETASKPEKVSSPLQERPSLHPYPEWAAMQAYYAPGVGVPPYFNSAVVSGHAPHPYVWAPQALMPPYGSPYQAIYSHGGGYSHPSVSFGSHPQGQGIMISSATSEPVLVTPPSIEPAKIAANNKERGLLKKLKGFDGLAVSVSNGSSENGGGASNGQSQSEEGVTEGSSNGTDGGNSREAHLGERKRSCSDDNAGKNGKGDMQSSSEDIDATKITLGVAVAHPNVTEKPVTISPLTTPSGTEYKVSATGKSKTSVAVIPLSNAAPVQGRDGEPWAQDERELKRERRKQSNRESARRSRLRKQAEAEELAQKVEALTSENMALKTEINRLSEMSHKLRQENSTLMEKLEGESTEAFNQTQSRETPPIAVENLLIRVNNSISTDPSEEQEDKDARESSGAKLHQLLGPCPRTDAVAAG